MRIRLLSILILALILSLCLPGAPTVIQGGASLSLAGCGLPGGLQLPAGQGIALRCRVRGEAPVIHVEFLVNQVVHHATWVRPGEVAWWSWVPDRAGRYTLAVAAREQGSSVVTLSRQVFVLAGDSPVRIP
jgi:hypothetical protein